MSAWEFMDELLAKGNEAYEQADKDSEEAPFLAVLAPPKGLELDGHGNPVDVPHRTIRKDPRDDTGSYSGKGHTTCPYTPCDRCGSARGHWPGAYRVMTDGQLVIRIVCMACMTVFRKNGVERSEASFGTNEEALQYAARLRDAKAKLGTGDGRKAESEDDGNQKKPTKKRKAKQ